MTFRFFCRDPMHTGLEQTLADLRRDGPRCFARWNAELFDAVASGPARTLGESLRGQPDSGLVLSGYLRLVQQAIGVGALLQSGTGARWTTFLERCLIERIPALLPRVQTGERLPLLAKVWNLGEGLLREPSWLEWWIKNAWQPINDDNKSRRRESPCHSDGWQGLFSFLHGIEDKRMSNQKPDPSHPSRPQSLAEQEIRTLLLRLLELLATRIVEKLRQQTPSEAGEMARISSQHAQLSVAGCPVIWANCATTWIPWANRCVNREPMRSAAPWPRLSAMRDAF